jgi:catechol 2,3-dioxygenase-like lactoylglutathione lyase family enzyme
MELGQFSVSLTVKDLEASLRFYELLGFEVVEGGHTGESFPDTETEKWRILGRGSTVIGLFQGILPQNILTWNPPDVRAIQRHLKENGVELIEEADPDSSGAAHIILEDPDGNQIMFDQW